MYAYTDYATINEVVHGRPSSCDGALGLAARRPINIYKEKMTNDDRRKNGKVRRKINRLQVALMALGAFILVLLYVIGNTP